MRIEQSKKADRPTTPTGLPLAARNRVLEVASEMFAEAGFHGTHFREISRRAGTNVAGICYHFQSKEGLYQAVMMEAGRQLSDLDAAFVTSTHLPPEERLVALTESLLQRLGSKRAWIAKLLGRELVDCAGKDYNYAASRLEQDFILLQAAMKNLPGAADSIEAIQVHAITLIAECVFYSLTGANPRHPLNHLAIIPSSRTLAEFLAQRSAKALQGESEKPEVPQP